MEHTKSMGPGTSSRDDKHEGRATIEGVDAHNASENDLKEGLAGAEAKPFSPPAAGSPEPEPSRDARATADNGSRDERLVSERRTPGRDDGVNEAVADPGGSER